MISGKIVKSNMIEAVTVISSATSQNCWPCHRQTGTALERLGRAPPTTPPTAPAAPAAAPRTAGVGPMNGSVLLERRTLSLWETPVKISYRGKSICWENLRFAVLWSILAFNNLPKSDLPSGVFLYVVTKISYVSQSSCCSLYETCSHCPFQKYFIQWKHFN